MDFEAILDQAIALLQRRGRLTYGALKRQFQLDDDYLADLATELIDGQRVAVDEDGKVLVWVGASLVPSSKFRVPSSQPLTSNSQPLGPAPRPPVSYTPAHLAERIRAVTVTHGERKTITALFADLKGSTALIEGLDPEEAQAIIDPALQLMMDAVHQYEGYVAQALGDGVFALFGAPLAHEDHPQRALYAALRMQETMRRYADALRMKGYPPLLMRVGLNTGEVVLRSIRKDDLHADYVPVGHSTNLAARMEQLANPGSIVVSAYTQHLTDGYFAFKDLGPTQIKGVADSLNLYEVLGVGPLRTRLQVSARRGLTRFVGRQSEMEQLQRVLEQTKSGHGQIVGTMGEPGLGKSRLFYEFKLLLLSGCLVLEAYSVSHGKATAYLPVIELLKDYFDIQALDEERKRREKVTGKVLTLDRGLEDALPYLSALLGIEEQPSPLQQMDPQIRRQRTFDALKKLLLRESLNQPVVLIFEDLHWIDGETQGFLDGLSESVASARLLLLTNYRPEYRHEWGQKTYYTQLRLAPLGQAEAEEFLDVLLGIAVGADRRVGPLVGAVRRDRPAEDADAPLQTLKQLILDKTQGTPFFMEEIVQELREQDVLRPDASVGWIVTQPTTALQIPTTVQAVLAARIDRLTPEEKALLQQLAVIGRQFPLSLVRQVITQPENDLYQLLASLQRKEFLYEQPAFPESDYIFKHALTQDVAYNSMLIERRKVLHERTGQAIELLYKDKLDEHYSELAHHYQRSANAEKAVTYLQSAGQQAVQRSANAEAIVQFMAALDLLKTIPPSSDRLQQELSVLIALGSPLIATKGYTAPEVGDVYRRARELCLQVGNTSQLFISLFGLTVFHILRAELATARELAEQLLRLAQNASDPALLLEAHMSLGIILLWCGDLLDARTHLAQGLALYEPHRHRSHVFLYGQEPGMVLHCHLAWVDWLLGYSDRALKSNAEAFALLKELDHPYSLAFALTYASWFHFFRRESLATHQQTEATIALCQEQGFGFFFARAVILQGWIMVEQGQWHAGVDRMHEGLTAIQEVGTKWGQPHFLTLLAQAYEREGRREEGISLFAKALAGLAVSGECWWEAEVYRIKGELLLM